MTIDTLIADLEELLESKRLQLTKHRDQLGNDLSELEEIRADATCAGLEAQIETIEKRIKTIKESN